jgi:hypothetical protein
MFRANALELKAEFQLLGGLSEMKPAFVSSQKGRAGKESPAIPANSLIGHEPLWHSRGWSRTTAMTLKSLKNATPVSASATRLSPRLAACSSPPEAAEDGLFRCCLPIIWSWRAGTSFSQICRRRSRSSKQNTVQTIRVLSPLSRAQAGTEKADDSLRLTFAVTRSELFSCPRPNRRNGETPARLILPCSRLVSRRFIATPRIPAQVGPNTGSNARARFLTKLFARASCSRPSRSCTPRLEPDLLRCFERCHQLATRGISGSACKRLKTSWRAPHAQSRK